MARCLFFVQGEGRGHLSQALAMAEMLESLGHDVVEVWTGSRNEVLLPAYYLQPFEGKHWHYAAPWLHRRANRRGIETAASIWLNTFRIPRYLKEVRRLRKRIATLRPEYVFNFYEGLAALALRRCPGGIRRIAVGHHFYHQIKRRRTGKTAPMGKRLLAWMSRIVAAGSDRILVLSFGAELQARDPYLLFPPLIRAEVLKSTYKPGKRQLAYFMDEGHIWDLIHRQGESPEGGVDVYCFHQALSKLPKAYVLQAPTADVFLGKLCKCSRLWTTAGFETVAEAAWLGVDIGLFPAEGHYEQYLNALDAFERGMAVPGKTKNGDIPLQIRTFDRDAYRAWVLQAKSLLKQVLGEY